MFKEAEFANYITLSINTSRLNSSPLLRVALFKHRDAGGGNSIGTPFGAVDAWHYFSGYGGENKLKSDLRAVQRRSRPGAELTAAYEEAGGDVVVSVRVLNKMSRDLGSETQVTLYAAVIENRKDPYFPTSVSHEASGAICQTVEMDGTADCQMTLKGAKLGGSSRVAVILTHRPDSTKQGHAGLQAVYATEGALPPFEAPPEVAQPLEDIEVEMDSASMEIDLSAVFTDSDNDDTAIVKSVLHNTNPDVVTPEISGNTLTLTFTPGMTGGAQVKILAESNGQSVEDRFLVDVIVPVDDPPSVANPMADVELESGDQLQIDLSAVFTDPDSDDAQIVKTVLMNLDTALVDAQISGNIMTLLAAPDRTGSAKITIQAESDGKTVTDDLYVNVKTPTVDPAPPSYDIYLPALVKNFSFGAN